MKLELSDDEVQQALKEYIDKRFPRYEMGAHDYRMSRGAVCDIQAIKVTINLNEKETR